MQAYSKAYLDEVVENQGKLFDYVAITYQWQYNIPSREVVEKIPLDYLKKAYAGLYDLDLELAVKKVGMV